MLNFDKHKINTLSSRISDKHKLRFILIAAAMFAMSFLILYLWRESLTSGSVDKRTPRNFAPTITADDGLLAYDSIHVNLPKDNATYTIGYDWAREDKDYPTIPASASVLYTNKSGQPAYEVLLYREKHIEKNPRNTKDDKILDTWFEGWSSLSDEHVKQQPYTTENTSGYLVSTHLEADEENKENCSYTYYFVVETAGAFEQFVLDVSFMDSDSIKNAESIFKACADGISVSS